MNRHPASSRQTGVVLLYTLIALVIMMIAGVALVRSFNTSLFSAGNLAFKRDLLNQAERVMPGVMTALKTGDLAADSTRDSHQPAFNYHASTLKSNDQGIPFALLNATDFAAVASETKNIEVKDDNDVTVATISYVIDRQCVNAGPPDESICALGGGGQTRGGTPDNPTPPSGGATLAVIYRVSVRVDGPRNTQAFLQTTLSW